MTYNQTMTRALQQIDNELQGRNPEFICDHILLDAFSSMSLHECLTFKGNNPKMNELKLEICSRRKALTILVGSKPMILIKNSPFKTAILDNLMNNVGELVNFECTIIRLEELTIESVSILLDLFPSVLHLTVAVYDRPTAEVPLIAMMLQNRWKTQLESFNLHLACEISETSQVPTLEETAKINMRMQILLKAINECVTLKHLHISTNIAFTLGVSALELPILQYLQSFYFASAPEDFNRFHIPMELYANQNESLEKIGLGSEMPDYLYRLPEEILQKFVHVNICGIADATHFTSLTSVALEQTNESMANLKRSLAVCKNLTAIQLNVNDMKAFLCEKSEPESNGLNTPKVFASIKIFKLGTEIRSHHMLAQMKLHEHMPNLQFFVLDNLALPRDHRKITDSTYEPRLECDICTAFGQKEISHAELSKCIQMLLQPLGNCEKLEKICMSSIVRGDNYDTDWPMKFDAIKFDEEDVDTSLYVDKYLEKIGVDLAIWRREMSEVDEADFNEAWTILDMPEADRGNLVMAEEEEQNPAEDEDEAEAEDHYHFG